MDLVSTRLFVARLACAQTGADLTLVSEYAMRDVSLYAHPALQLRVDHDADGGPRGVDCRDAVAESRDVE